MRRRLNPQYPNTQTPKHPNTQTPKHPNTQTPKRHIPPYVFKHNRVAGCTNRGGKEECQRVSNGKRCGWFPLPTTPSTCACLSAHKNGNCRICRNAACTTFVGKQNGYPCAAALWSLIPPPHSIPANHALPTPTASYACYRVASCTRQSTRATCLKVNNKRRCKWSTSAAPPWHCTCRATHRNGNCLICRNAACTAFKGKENGYSCASLALRHEPSNRRTTEPSPPVRERCCVAGYSPAPGKTAKTSASESTMEIAANGSDDDTGACFTFATASLSHVTVSLSRK